jgi:hypothetical protein
LHYALYLFGVVYQHYFLGMQNAQISHAKLIFGCANPAINCSTVRVRLKQHFY